MIKHNSENEIKQLRDRIKLVSTIRFFASKRIQFNYSISKLTVVILSLWSILIGVILSQNGTTDDINLTRLLSIMLPVFILVFSLIEDKEYALRAHFLEECARELRYLADDIQIQNSDLDKKKIRRKYTQILKQYQKILDKYPANHAEIDYLTKRAHEMANKDKKEESERTANRDTAVKLTKELAILWIRRQTQRVFYILLWFLPGFILLILKYN